MPKSMTGFAREIEQLAWGEISCEIRSVNHRYLEPIIRLPDVLRALEPVIRDQLRQSLQRGKVEVTFQVNLHDNRPQGMDVNRDLLDSLVSAIAQVRDRCPESAPVDPIRLLQWPGVIDQASVDGDTTNRIAAELFSKVLSSLVAHRQREGALLQGYIQDRLTQIAALAQLVSDAMPDILDAQRDKLRQRLEAFNDTLDADRVEQEMVILANKADVAEELDRLQTHIQEVGHILQQTTPVGRRLDFMMQELNREANTLSSKSLSGDTTQAAVSIKVLIEQMREQIQNIE